MDRCTEDAVRRDEAARGGRRLSNLSVAAGREVQDVRGAAADVGQCPEPGRGTAGDRSAGGSGGEHRSIVAAPAAREWRLPEQYGASVPAIQRVLDAIDAALGGKLDEHEETVWRVRNVGQELIGDREPVPWD